MEKIPFSTEYRFKRVNQKLEDIFFIDKSTFEDESGYFKLKGLVIENNYFISQNSRKTTPYPIQGHFILKIKPKIASRDTQLGSCIVQQFCDGFVQDL